MSPYAAPAVSALIAALGVFGGVGSAMATPPDLPADVEWVSWEPTSLGPSCGDCHKTTITAAYDGWVWIEEGYWADRSGPGVWRTTTREVQVLPAALARFRERLAPFRPTKDLALRAVPPCKSFTDDLVEITVVWHDRKGAARLLFDFGCDFYERREMREALRTAPTLLEIDGLSSANLMGATAPVPKF